MSIPRWPEQRLRPSRFGTDLCQDRIRALPSGFFLRFAATPVLRNAIHPRSLITVNYGRATYTLSGYVAPRRHLASGDIILLNPAARNFTRVAGLSNYGRAGSYSRTRLRAPSFGTGAAIAPDD
jgi:hypothetical protein